MIEAATRLVEKGVIQPFDDDKKLEQYTVDDFEELIQANIDQKLQATAESAPVELFKTIARRSSSCCSLCFKWRARY